MLGPTRHKTEMKIAELQEDHWQDLRTRVVFIEFTVYNVNQDLFSQVTLITEFLVSGEVQLKCKVNPLSSCVKYCFSALATDLVRLFDDGTQVYLNDGGEINYWALH